MGFFLAIAAVVATGTLIAYAIVLTLKWLKNKIKNMFLKRNVKKVACVELEKLVEECPNEMSLDQLLDEGNTHLMASVDDYGKIDEVNVIKDIGDGDYEVDRMLGSEGMIVINR